MPTPQETFIIKSVVTELSKSLGYDASPLAKLPIDRWSNQEIIHLGQLNRRAPQCVKVFVTFLPSH